MKSSPRTLGFAVLLTAALFGALCPPAFAGGPVHGAKAAGMGTTFVAVADDPSAILFNPAGLTQMLGTSLYAGATGLIIASTFEAADGEEERTDDRSYFPPHAFVSSDLRTRDFRFGLGLDAPYGVGGRKWDRDGLTRYASTRSEIGTFAVNPTLAWRPWPAISLGVGVDYMKVQSRSERMLDQSALGAPDGRLTLSVEGWGWGCNAGLLVKLPEGLRLGFAYRSRIRTELSGDASLYDIAPALQPAFGGTTFETGAQTTLRFPEVYSLGVAYQPSPALTLAVDVEWVRWSSFDRLDVDLDQEVPAAGFADSSTRLDWRDSWQFKAGVDYRASEALSLRAGYGHFTSIVPDSTLEPGNPDAESHLLSAGAGYRAGSWTLDAFYLFQLCPRRSVDNEVLDGRYRSWMQYFGASVGYRL